MKKETIVTQDIIFRERLKSLRNGRSLKEVACDLGISRASLGYYESGERKPDIDILLKLANYYNVSSDYLLGLSNTRSQNCDIQLISKTTGLNERSIDTLKDYQNNANREPNDAYDTTPMHCKLIIDTINRLLHPSSDVLENITNYLYLNLDHYYDDDNFDDEDCYKHISNLSFFDKKLGVSFGEDYDYISQIFLVMIQNELAFLRTKTQSELPHRTTPLATTDANLPESE